jgi:hypothetical protein
MSWLRITNFEIDCRFLKPASEEKNADNLIQCMNNDLYYGLCTLYDEARPYIDRPPQGFLGEHVYIEKYSRLLHEKIPVLEVALHIVRDVLRFTRTRYDEATYRFTTPMKPTLDFIVIDEMFDYPSFEPFRYAHKLITESGNWLYGPPDRTATGGEFCYHLRFRVINDVPNQDDHQSIRLRDYVDKNSPNFPSS